MRPNYFAVLAISLAVSSFAVPLFSSATEEEGLYLRWDDYDIDTRALTWHDGPSNKRHHQTQELALHPGETDPHITSRTDRNGKVSNYQGWKHDERIDKMRSAGRWGSEGKERDGINHPIDHPLTGSAHTARPEHDPDSLRSRSLTPQKRGISWHDVPDDKKHHQTGKLAPHPGETDPHITYRKDSNGHVTNYQGWQYNEHAGKMTNAGRWRGEGKEHGGIKPPIYYPPTGKAHAAGPEHDPNRSRSPSPKRA